ncbi:MAG: glycoside hydrolase family 127 protein, partial [Myxococcota bacterium]|nr:glycoside hydrolase family 127 protein [Myxococcota bacterium]
MKIPRSQTTKTVLLSSVKALSLMLAIFAPATASAAVEVLQDFDLDKVQVSDPYYQNVFNQDLSYLLSINSDRLLAPFKIVSQGQDPQTAVGVNLYGGWESGGSLLRGHTMGHYLSALASAYKQTLGGDQTQNAQIKTTIDYVIAQLKAFQDKGSNGYLFGSPEAHFDVVEGKAQGKQWVPWYTMHKIIAGLVDVYKFEGNATALAIASKLGDWVYNRTSTWSPSVRALVLGIEYGGMNDCLYELYKFTGSPNHAAAAHMFDEDAFFTTISNGTDNLNGKHANTQIPKFIGALNRYRALGPAGQDLYLKAAQQFWAIVTRDHTYVTGGNSRDEHFGPPGALDPARDNTNDESCNSYNMMKLTRDLFKVTGDSKYPDFYERGHLNEVMSAINPTNGMTTYFKPMASGYFKLFGRQTDTFWCCNGTGMENYTKLGDSLYFHDATDLYVNQYISSTLNWTARGLALTLSTDLPLSSMVKVTIAAAPADAANLKFRVPTWIAGCQAPVVTVNGRPFNVSASNGYLGVSRVWTAGDEVDLTFPPEVRVSRLPDNPNAVAFVYGPVVLSASFGTQQLVGTAHALTEAATLAPGMTVDDTIAINGGTTIDGWIANINSNLVQTPGKLEFTLKNTNRDNDLKFTPQYQRYADRYGIYFRLTGTAGGAIPDAGVCSPGSGAPYGTDGGSIGNADSGSGIFTSGDAGSGGNDSGAGNSPAGGTPPASGGADGGAGSLGGAVSASGSGVSDAAGNEATPGGA